MKVPCHVAVIPDGNRRWAKKRGLPIIEGYRRGSDTLSDILEIAFDLGVIHFSIWGISESNIINRAREWVDSLDRLFETNFNTLAQEKKIHEREVKINVYGKWMELLRQETKESIWRALKATEKYNRLTLNLFIAYSGTEELLDAIRRILEKSKEEPGLDITPGLLKKHLLTCDLPPVDLLIRTGGEPHLSDGFMMWDVADAQLYFSDKFWPEFTPEDFQKAIEDYSKRGRRFGE
jgi:tritrans,polycis-undecaprenyl-diphosphate synthase [geranylgeranyl-diphosphate specific]